MVGDIEHEQPDRLPELRRRHDLRVIRIHGRRTGQQRVRRAQDRLEQVGERELLISVREAAAQEERTANASLLPGT